MNDLEQLQLFLNQTQLRYRRCVKRFDYSSPITDKAVQQLIILLKVMHESLDNWKKHPRKGADYIQIYEYSTIKKHINQLKGGPNSL